MCRALLYLGQPVLLDKDTSAWVEPPEYGALFAEIRHDRPRVAVRLLD